MNLHAAAADLISAEKIANAVLYEGYILYPYRPSSVKNRQRWTFGGVYPKEYSTTSGEASSQQTQVLVTGSERTALDVHVRFLHLLARQVRDANDCIVESMRVNGKMYHTWQEAVERKVHSGLISMRELCDKPYRVEFAFPAKQQVETLENGGKLVRTQYAVQGVVELFAEKVGEEVFRVTERIENNTPLDAAAPKTRDDASLYAFVSTHSILSAFGGEFVSLMDAPQEFRVYATACKNIGTYPVLVGEQGTRNMMLSSPIILYDYPQIAPESAGDLFDGTEIDEILSLRILTLTDEEKQELRETDARGAAMLERTEALSPEVFARLHGTLRSVEPKSEWEFPTQGDWNGADLESDRVPIESVQVGGVAVRAGDTVRIRPKRSADAIDMLLDGRAATIESIQQDFEERIYLAVTVDDDPGKDFGAEKFIAHRFFYSVDEVEPL